MNNLIHKTRIQIRFKDVDKQGHVNNANHLTYVETARVAYFREVLGKQVDWDATGLLLARTEIDYLEPIFLEDELEVHTGVTRIGSKSFDMENLIVKINDSGPRTCAKIKSVFVCYDYHSKSSIEVPNNWKNNFIEFEKHLS